MKQIVLALLLVALPAISVGCGNSTTNDKQPKLTGPPDPKVTGPATPGTGAPQRGAAPGPGAN
jgi:hypothetical protein